MSLVLNEKYRTYSTAHNLTYCHTHVAPNRQLGPGQQILNGDVPALADSETVKLRATKSPNAEAVDKASNQTFDTFEPFHMTRWDRLNQNQ